MDIRQIPKNGGLRRGQGQISVLGTGLRFEFWQGLSFRYTRKIDSGFIARYAADGTLQFVSKTDGSDFSSIHFKAAASTEDGGVIAAGQFHGMHIFGPDEPGETAIQSVGAYRGFLCKFRDDGSLQWIYQTTGDQGVAYFDSLAITPDGNIWVAGSMAGTALFTGKDGHVIQAPPCILGTFVAKYGPDGSLLFVHGTTHDEVSELVHIDLSLSASGGVLVSGRFGGSAIFMAKEPGETRLFSSAPKSSYLAEYRSNGSLAWVRRAAANKTDDYDQLMISDADSDGFWGALQYTGEVKLDPGEAGETTIGPVGSRWYDVALLRFHPDGSLASARPIVDAPSSAIIRRTPDGGALLAAHSYGYDMRLTDMPGSHFPGGSIIAKFNGTGQLEWVQGLTHVLDLRLTAAGDAIVTGSFVSSVSFGGASNDLTTLKETQPYDNDSGDIFLAKYNIERSSAGNWMKYE